jgi:hypothetical protein
MNIRTHSLVCAAGLLVLAGRSRMLGQNDDNATYPYLPFDHPVLAYAEPAGNDPIARLEKRLQAGQAKLEYDLKWGYLPSVLKSLNVNIDSQMLVFSKTSFQSPRIAPPTPRALYFMMRFP